MSKRLKEMILFENEHLIVINKDHGVPSQMGTGLSLNHSADISIDNML
jgi:23S rRNA-/tRNA-specific pseudouridylate synthase